MQATAGVHQEHRFFLSERNWMSYLDDALHRLKEGMAAMIQRAA